MKNLQNINEIIMPYSYSNKYSNYINISQNSTGRICRDTQKEEEIEGICSCGFHQCIGVILYNLKNGCISFTHYEQGSNSRNIKKECKFVGKNFCAFIFSNKKYKIGEISALDHFCNSEIYEYITKKAKKCKIVCKNNNFLSVSKSGEINFSTIPTREACRIGKQDWLSLRDASSALNCAFCEIGLYDINLEHDGKNWKAVNLVHDSIKQKINILCNKVMFFYDNKTNNKFTTLQRLHIVAEKYMNSEKVWEFNHKISEITQLLFIYAIESELYKSAKKQIQLNETNEKNENENIVINHTKQKPKPINFGNCEKVKFNQSLL